MSVEGTTTTNKLYFNVCQLNLGKQIPHFSSSAIRSKTEPWGGNGIGYTSCHPTKVSRHQRKLTLLIKPGKITRLILSSFTTGVDSSRKEPCSVCVSSSTPVLNNKEPHTRPFNGPFPVLPGWAGIRKAKPIWILIKQERVSSSGISWAICKSAPSSRQITIPAPPTEFFFTCQMHFLLANQQRQSTEGNYKEPEDHKNHIPVNVSQWCWKWR